MSKTCSCTSLELSFHKLNQRADDWAAGQGQLWADSSALVSDRKTHKEELSNGGGDKATWVVSHGRDCQMNVINRKYVKVVLVNMMLFAMNLVSAFQSVAWYTFQIHNHEQKD